MNYFENGAYANRLRYHSLRPAMLPRRKRRKTTPDSPSCLRFVSVFRTSSLSENVDADPFRVWLHCTVSFEQVSLRFRVVHVGDSKTYRRNFCNVAISLDSLALWFFQLVTSWNNMFRGYFSAECLCVLWANGVHGGISGQILLLMGLWVLVLK